MEVVSFGLRCVVDVDGISTTGNYDRGSVWEDDGEVASLLTVEDRSTVEIFPELLGVHGST